MKNTPRRLTKALLAGLVGTMTLVAVPSVVDAKVGIYSGTATPTSTSYVWGKPTRTNTTIAYNDCGVKGYLCNSWKPVEVRLGFYVKGNPAMQYRYLLAPYSSSGWAYYQALTDTKGVLLPVCTNKTANVRVTWTWTTSYKGTKPANTTETISGYIGGGVAC